MESVLVLLALSPLGRVCAGPLQDYVYRPDPHYKYDVLKDLTYRAPGYTLYYINMTSQKWQTEDVVDKPIWWHYVVVTVPDKIAHSDSAFLFVDGGSNRDRPPEPSEKFVAVTSMIALGMQCVGVDLRMIPNQPLVFKADPTQKSRSEDAIIAWTWKEFVQVNSSNPEFLLRFPMTKAVVRAMDTVVDFVGHLLQQHIENFYVSGASKRGWTTWTTAAVDPRVKAAAPIVMDLLNMVKSLHHHYRAYGGWTFEFNDYYDLNFTIYLGDPNMQKMADLIDPISYNAQLTMPKMIISTGGDEFFLPDDSYYYYRQLTGPKYLRMLPNAEHSCIGHVTSLALSIRAFFLSVITATPLPAFSWTREYTARGGRLTVITKTVPTSVTCFWATTIGGKRRDFRLFVGAPDNPRKAYPHPVWWHSQSVVTKGNNTYVVEFDNPDVGWRAFFIQLTFPGVKDMVLEFTTETHIIPDTFPFPDCAGTSCRGNLV